MKRLIAIALLGGFLATGTLAQTKVIEKSSKKVPAWLSSASEDYLVVTANAPTLEEAQQKAARQIVEQVISAVATNISVSTQNVTMEKNDNGTIDTQTRFAHMAKLRAANLPFLKDISMAKVTGVYWRKLRDKSTNVEFYEYAAQYPFPESERQELVRQFEALDAEKMAELKAVDAKYYQIEAVNEIEECIGRLRPLKGFFIDDTRLSQVDNLIKRFEMLYSSITPTGTFLEPGKYQFQMLLDGNPIRISVRPKVTSNCASQIQVVPAEGAFVVTYNAIDCLPDEENFLNIAFKLRNRPINHKVYISEAQGASTRSFSVVPEGKVILTADSVVAAERKLFNLNIRLTLNNRGGTPFGLKAIELEVPDLAAPIVFDDVDAVYKTRGILQIRAVAEGEFTARTQKSDSLKFVQGALMLVNPETGAVERVRLSLPYITNWEE